MYRFTVVLVRCSVMLTLSQCLIVIGTTQEALATEVKIKVQNEIQRFFSSFLNCNGLCVYAIVVDFLVL